MAQTAIADESLARNTDGQTVLTLKTPYRDGTKHIVLSPLEFMQRLAALVPRPRLNLIRLHGVLAPNATGLLDGNLYCHVNVIPLSYWLDRFAYPK